jgi:hypothetical protein
VKNQRPSLPFKPSPVNSADFVRNCTGRGADTGMIIVSHADW